MNVDVLEMALKMLLVVLELTFSAFVFDCKIARLTVPIESSISDCLAGWLAGCLVGWLAAVWLLASCLAG